MGARRGGIWRPCERAVSLGTGQAGHHIGVRCPDLVERDAARTRRVDDEVAPLGAEPRGKLGLQRVGRIEGPRVEGSQRRLVCGEHEQVDYDQCGDGGGHAPARPRGTEDHDRSRGECDRGGDGEIGGDGPQGPVRA